MLGDIILAEPKALIGFAGPRVIEQTIGQKLPKGFQRSEFLLEHGFVDAIVDRASLRKTLDKILSLHSVAGTAAAKLAATDVSEIVNEETGSGDKAKTTRRRRTPKHEELTAWDRVSISRKMDRPVADDYIDELFTDFIEMHGDRYFKDDKAIIGGVARLNGVPVTVIAQAKGRSTKENIERSFGMPSPDGYRKALRLMKQAEKFNRPVICFVDTPGAFCGLEAEERGQGEAIARNLFEMSELRVPILSIVIGEGGSGGALACAVADQVWMLENAIYAILSPEGYASILWKDSKRANEAASEMKLTASDLLELKIVDRIFDEPSSLTKETMAPLITEVRNAMSEFLAKNENFDADEIVKLRYERFRRM